MTTSDDNDLPATDQPPRSPTAATQDASPHPGHQHPEQEHPEQEAHGGSMAPGLVDDTGHPVTEQ